MNIWEWFTAPLKPLKGPQPSSPKGRLNLADWLSAARVKIYTIAAVAADHVLNWLAGINTQGHAWWFVLAIGVAMGVAELLRRLDKDYSKPPSAPPIDVPPPSMNPVDDWANRKHGN